MSDRFESLESGEVVSIQNETQVLSGHRTFRSGELNDTIKSLVEQAIAGWSEDKNDWFTDRGIDCEALRFGSKGWQKGRIRLSLEFCPDEPDQLALSASSASSTDHQHPTQTESASTPFTPVSSAKTTTSTYEDEVLSLEQDLLPTTVTTNVVASSPTQLGHPLISTAGVGVTMGAVASVAAMSTDFYANTNTVDQNTHQSIAIPHFDDAVLEPEHHDVDPISPNSGGLDELAFVFDENDNDRGRMIPNGMMEIDLADGLDFSEHDLLSFEANGLADADGFGSFHDIGKPENSGALIDEVWNEMNQGSWPTVN